MVGCGGFTDFLMEECKKKDKEIAVLKGTVEFHKGEQKTWRKLFNEQRGGETFNKMQKEYADTVAENIKLRNEIKKLEKEQ